MSTQTTSPKTKDANAEEAERQERLRGYARISRDWQWRFMDRCAEVGTLWFTPWETHRRPQGPDEWRDALLSGNDICARFEQHPDWFVIGKWDDERGAMPVSLTEVGRAALADRARWDLEPYRGGMVAPGWTVIPAPPPSPIQGAITNAKAKG